MPTKPKRLCAQPGCYQRTSGSYCLRHQDQARQQQTKQRKQSDRYRGSSASRGYGHRWRVRREQYLNEHPLCVQCSLIGLVKPATVVDHRIPHRGDQDLFWDEGNWQALCKSCHDKKTAKEDGGFNNPASRARGVSKV